MYILLMTLSVPVHMYIKSTGWSVRNSWEEIACTHMCVCVFGPIWHAIV